MFPALELLAALLLLLSLGGHVLRSPSGKSHTRADRRGLRPRHH